MGKTPSVAYCLPLLAEQQPNTRLPLLVLSKRVEPAMPARSTFYLGLARGVVLWLGCHLGPVGGTGAVKSLKFINRHLILNETKDKISLWWHNTLFWITRSQVQIPLPTFLSTCFIYSHRPSRPTLFQWAAVPIGPAGMIVSFGQDYAFFLLLQPA